MSEIRGLAGAPSRGRSWLWLVVGAALCWAFSDAAPVLAQGAQGASELGVDPQTGRLPTVVELFQTSTIINSIILGLSVVALLLFLYFVVTVSPASLAPTTFIDDVSKLVINRRYDEAATLCRANGRVFIATVIQRCAENAGKEHSVILDMIDSEGRRRADLLWNRISYLADIANIAPMLGLLGTVVGMIQAFFLLPEQSGSISSRVLSQGIGGAMATTMFGLIVGILSLVFYSIVKNRATQALAAAEQVVHSVADHIKRGGA